MPLEQVARIHASSGTTGKPTVVGYTKNDLASWGNLVARSIRAAGGRAGMKVHIAYGYGLFTGGLGAHYGAEAAGCTVIPMSVGQTERQVQLIRDFAPEIIMVTPSYMLALLDEFRRVGVDPRATSLRIGMFGAEPWGEGMRAEIENAFGIDACDIYGLSEVMGPGVAQEFAQTKDGATIWEDHFIPEIVDPVTRRAAGRRRTQGELVFTSLTKEAMPVIRYRTRDLTRLLPGSLTAMRRMARIGGRSDDMLIVRGVNVFPSQIEEMILRCPGWRRTTKSKSPVPTASTNCGSWSRREPTPPPAQPAEAALLGAKLKDLIGISAQIDIVACGSLPRSAGKARHVRDRR